MTRAPSATRAAAFANPTHIYVIGYDNGEVKVGRTSDPRHRLITLTSEASRRGARVTDRTFMAVDDARFAEWYLRLAAHAEFPSARGTEYFVADFETFLSRAGDRWRVYQNRIDLPEWFTPASSAVLS